MSSGAPSAPTAPGLVGSALAVPAAAAQTASNAAQGAVIATGTVVRNVTNVPAMAAQAATTTETKAEEALNPLVVPDAGVGRIFEVAVIIVYATKKLSEMLFVGYPDESFQSILEELQSMLADSSLEANVVTRISGYAGAIAEITNERDTHNAPIFVGIAEDKLGKVQSWATPQVLAQVLNANKNMTKMMTDHAKKELGLVDGDARTVTQINKGIRMGGGKTFVSLNGPLFEDVKTQTYQPCGYRETLVQENGRWMVTCERTTMANTKKCTLYRITEPKVKLSEVECRKGNLTVIKEIGLSQNLVRDSQGNVRRETEITPVIATIPISSDEKVMGTPIMFSRANAKPEAKRASNLGTVQTVETKETRLGGGKAGKTTKALPATSASAAKVQPKVQQKTQRKAGARVSLPSGEELHKIGRDDTKITDLDLDLIGLPRNEQGEEMYPEPQEWNALRQQPGGELDSDQFYALEDNAAGRGRTEGFAFAIRHKPVTHISMASAQSYLNWLIGLLFRMRAFHPQSFSKLYRAPFDTIAVMEAYVLNGIGNLEAMNLLPNIKELWTPQDASMYSDWMHPILKEYVKRTSTEKWDSVLPMRNTNLPKDDFGVIIPTLNGGEGAAFTSLKALVDQMKLWKPLGVTVGDEKIQFPFRWPVDLDKVDCIAILDDIVVAFLSDVQYRMGYAVNFWQSDIANYTTQLFTPQQKRHLSADLIRYIDTFGNPDDEIPLLIRLDEPRAKVISGKLRDAGLDS